MTKRFRILSVIVILLAMALILFGKSSIFNSNPYVEIGAFLLFFLFFVFDLILEIIERKYTTSVWIILVDAMKIGIYLLVLFVNYQHADTLDNDILFHRSTRIMRCFLILSALDIIKNFLKSQKFKKPVQEMEE